MSYVLIWSREHSGWWRPYSQGYSNNIACAGLYLKSEADEIVSNSNGREFKFSLSEGFKLLQKQALTADNTLMKLFKSIHETNVLERM
jgi:hypothetical protein